MPEETAFTTEDARRPLKRTAHRRIATFASFTLIATLSAACSSADGNERGSASGADNSAGVAAAKEATEKNLQEPTTIGVTQPLESKPEAGKTIVYMKCNQAQCIQQGDALKEAATTIGWKYEDIPFNSEEPATLVSAMKQALTKNPVAVSLPVIGRELWESVVPAYKDAGVYIVPNSVGPMEYDETVIGQLGGNQEAWGEIMANWAIADSNGKANVLVETVPSFPILGTALEGYQKTMKKNCPECKMTVVENTIPQLVGGQIPGTMVAALQKDPSINYTYTVSGAFNAGLVPALKAAGLDDRVKISGGAGDQSNLSAVKNGTEHAYNGAAIEFLLWGSLDMVLRKTQGMDFDPNGGTGPTQLLTKDVDFETSSSYNKPVDWKAQFAKLWLVK